MSKDLYSNNAVRLDTIIGDAAKIWSKVNAAKREFDSKGSKESFYAWLQQEYGLKLKFTPDGDLELANEVIDRAKYLIFLLKFSND